MTHARKLKVCTFANKTTTTPSKVAEVSWAEILNMHKKRRPRPNKDGEMLGGYALNGTRNDENVPYRSLIQLDIDTEGFKDKKTGRILKVERRAPPLKNVREGINEYEWCAASSHWHEPERGVIKYRIVVLPDRDILPDEHEPLLEALNDKLGWSLDRDAWQWSQAFYLPSCPPENESQAFFEHNEGVPLPVDEFVRRGREIIKIRDEMNSLGANMGVSPKKTALPETEANIAKARSMAEAIPADIKYGPWRNILWALASTGWDCAKELAESWSKTCPEKWDDHKFEEIWNAYDPERANAIHFGSLVYYARQHGWVAPVTEESLQFTGNGGDVWNGKKFAEMYRDQLLFLYDMNEWVRFDPGIGWTIASPYEAEQAAKAVLKKLNYETAERWKANPDDQKIKFLRQHVERTSKAPHLNAMVEMAKSEPGMSTMTTDFDQNPMLLGVTNGVLDLKSGRLLPVTPDVRVRKRCAVEYDPEASCPRFEQFMEEILPDPEIREFLRRLLGYCLTGRTDEQIFAFLHGGGDNGKTLLVELVAWLMQDYSHKMPTESLMVHQRNPQGPSPDIVALQGIRFAFASETEEDSRLAAAHIKSLTGGDTLSGRVPYGKANISFEPTHKLVIVGNHKPVISDQTVGMWRRVKLIPFDQTIPENKKDTRLLDKLKPEGPGILNWLLQGLAEWKSKGLATPDDIKASIAAYRGEQDILGEFLSEKCKLGADCTVGKQNLYFAYRAWAEINGLRPMSNAKLTRRLSTRNIGVAPDKRTYSGVKLKGIGLNIGGRQ